MEAIASKNEQNVELQQIAFEFENHDDLFKIIEIAKSKKLFETENHSIEFALGIKLFTEVVLKNKENPLFKEFKPAITESMKKLKEA